MGRVRELSDRLMRGEVEPDFHPFSPMFALEEVASRAAFVSSFANVLAIETHEGLVLVDVGSFFFAKMTKEIVRGFTPKPLHTVVYTHGHVDHVFGVELYEEEHPGHKAQVIAHENLPARFDRYRETGGYNACINARQFQTQTAWPTDYRYPDKTFASSLELNVGGVELCITHSRGETDDHAYVWLPEQRVLATGDLFIWATPNAGNPQKVQRYPREWARALRAMAKLGAEVLCPGHGPPIFGAGAVNAALSDTAALLEHLVAQTLMHMNEGASLDAILASVKAPKELLEKPYLRPIYDEPEFIVRNVYRLYGGWWDGNPAHLKPGPEAALAVELCRLAGGAKVLAERALSLSAAGEHALACHLAETAYRGNPEDPAARAARSRVYQERAEVELSLMAKGIYKTAARETE